MKIHKKLTIIAVASMTLGLAGLAPLAYFHIQTKEALAKTATVQIPAVAPKPAPAPTLITGKPVHISIPSLSMELGVIDGVYNAKTGEWTLTSDKAQYAVPTVQPNNEDGNTLIYGHYRPQVFAYLHLIKPGATATITTDNGYAFTYTFQKSETIDPADTSIFLYKGAPRLTIQTCTGAFMQNRQMYYFSLTSVTKV